MQAKHENHYPLRQNKLCPFKFLSERKTVDSICNWHTNLEIICITEGAGAAQYGGESIPIAKGDIVVVNVGVLHAFTSERGFDFIGIIIDDGFCKENGISPEKLSFRRILRNEETEQRLLSAAELIEKYKKDRNPLFAAKSRCAVLELLIDMIENHSDTAPENSKIKNASEEHVKKVIGYLYDHYSEAVTLDGLAQMCGITKFHLAREFKRFTAETVFTYLNALKCKNAESCLASGMSVTETALACGFESVSYFSRTYKRVMGCTPSTVKTV